MYLLIKKTNLESFTLFEDPNDGFTAAIEKEFPRQNMVPNHGLNYLPASALMTASVSLHHIAVSFSVTAEGFFSANATRNTWPSLRPLALRCCYLASDGATPVSDWEPIMLPAFILKRMPALETLVLWWSTSQGGYGCALI